MATFFAKYPGSASAGSNASVGTNGAAIPTSSTLAGGEDPSLNLQPLQLDASKNLKVNVAAGTLTVLNPSVSATGSAVPPDATYLGVKNGANMVGLTEGQATMANSLPVAIASDQSAVPISAAALPLPAGASTSALQTSGNTSLSSIDGKLASLGQKTMAGSEPVVIASDQSAIPVSISGNQAINLVQVAGASVATGHGTAAGSIRVEIPTDGNGVIGLNAGSNIIGKAGIDQTTPGTTNAVSLAQIGANAILTGNGVTGTGSQRVTIASDNSAIQIKSPVNTNGNNSESTVSTVKTETVPANAVGFILMNEDTSTANIRWKIGGVAAAASGQQLQPGRDTVFVPCAANVSLCAESGTQNYNLQWVLSS